MLGVVAQWQPASTPDTIQFAWVIALLFLTATLLTRRGHESGRTLAAVTWGIFGVFWLSLVPYFAFEHQSWVEAILAVVALPACAYAGYLLYSGRDSLFLLTRAVMFMLLIYLPFTAIPAMTVAGVTIPEPRRVFIELVASQTLWAINLVGYTPTLIESPEGYQATFEWLLPGGDRRILVHTVLACTGIGSMAIFGGLIAAVKAPVVRKVRALGVAIPIIYVLNIARTTFINIAYGKQLMHWYPDVVLFLFGAENPYRVSFLISDRIISQLLAVVALIGITYLVARELPELVIVLEDVLYVLTGEEHDLLESMDLPREPVERADPTGTRV